MDIINHFYIEIPLSIIIRSLVGSVILLMGSKAFEIENVNIPKCLLAAFIGLIYYSLIFNISLIVAARNSVSGWGFLGLFYYHPLFLLVTMLYSISRAFKSSFGKSFVLSACFVLFDFLLRALILIPILHRIGYSHY